MNKAFVADDSVAVSWCTPAQGSEATDRLLDDIVSGSEITVPPLWTYETSNALLILWRGKKLTAAEYSEARALLDRFRLSVDSEGARLAATRVSDLAVQHALTVYDAAYLELALRKHIPLASRDRRLNRAARGLGVTLSL